MKFRKIGYHENKLELKQLKHLKEIFINVSIFRVLK